MVRLTRGWIFVVVVVILGALFVDGFGAAYQAYASQVTDPSIGCNDVSLRAQGLTAATGSYTVTMADGPDEGKVVNAIPNATTGLLAWNNVWTYPISRGGGQQIAVINAHSLINATSEQGFAPQSSSKGYHYRITIDKTKGGSQTVWVNCKATVATPESPTPSVAPSPTATAKAGAKPVATPKPTPTPTPSPSASPSASASPMPVVTSGGAKFWIDAYGAPSIPLLGWYQLYLHKGLDLVGGSELTIVICHGPNNPAGSTCRNGLDAHGGDYAAAQAATIPIIEQRVNGLGVAEASVVAQGNDKIVVELPGVSLDQAVATLGTTSKLHFAQAVAGAPFDSTTGEISATMVKDQEGLYSDSQLADTNYYPSGYHWKIDDALQASMVTSASATTDQSGQPAVAINFNSQGADEWSKMTTAAFAQTAGSPTNRVAIFIDNQVLTAPQVEAVSSSSTIISGGLTQAGAIQLASQINAGALPADISTIQSTSVSATLGQETIHQSFVAGAIGLIIVVLFMLAYYRFPGLLASLALAAYAAIVLAVFKITGVTVTLAGLAGFILSVGMAVDANVLIFERTRDELRHGRPVSQAVDTGFHRAMPAIRDSNVSTSIACLVLIAFGTDVIRGFAVTLLIGVLVSFFSAVLVTRSLFAWALKRRFGLRPTLYTQIHEEYAANPPKGRFDIVKSRNIFFAASLAIIIPGLLAICFWGFRLGLDFAGGNLVDAHLSKTASLSQVQDTVNSVASDLQPEIQAESDNHFSIRTLPAPVVRMQQITNSLQAKYGFVTDPATNKPDVQYDQVGPTIAADLVRSAVVLVLVASFLIAIYLAIMFGRQRLIDAKRFAICTIFKLLHDVFVLLGIWAILGHFSVLGEVDSLFVTAVLTSVAFSIHDTIVVFDRVRENISMGPRLTFDQVINLSTVQTMTRSLNTALTVVFVLLSLVLFGGDSIRGFVLALLIGIVTGTYSSIFNASTLLVAWRSLDKDREERANPKARRKPATV